MRSTGGFCLCAISPFAAAQSSTASSGNGVRRFVYLVLMENPRLELSLCVSVLFDQIKLLEDPRAATQPTKHVFPEATTAYKYIPKRFKTPQSQSPLASTPPATAHPCPSSAPPSAPSSPASPRGPASGAAGSPSSAPAPRTGAPRGRPPSRGCSARRPRTRRRAFRRRGRGV